MGESYEFCIGVCHKRPFTPKKLGDELLKKHNFQKVHKVNEIIRVEKIVFV